MVLSGGFLPGFGLLFAAPLFKGDKLQVAIRAGMTLSGLLCLVGVSGPASGDLRLQYPDIVGYPFCVPLCLLSLAILFARFVESAAGRYRGSPKGWDDD